MPVRVVSSLATSQDFLASHMLSLDAPAVNGPNCLIIIVTGGGIVAAAMVLPKGRQGDAGRYTGICWGRSRGIARQERRVAVEPLSSLWLYILGDWRLLD